jgi:cell division protein FtsI/penicillin-binding protein 2
MKYRKIKEIILFGLVNLFFISSALLFISTVYGVQFSNSDYFQNQALSYREKVVTLEASRGSIYDRNLNVVSSSIQAYDIGIRPNEVTNKKELSDLLSVFLQLESKEILDELESRKNFFYLARDVDFDIGTEIKSWNQIGVYPEVSSKRIIHSDPLKNIVGSVDPDNNGIEGLELYYNYRLTGKDGELRYEAAPNGSIIPQGEINTIQPIHGEDIILSIDGDLQYLSEDLCATALLETNAYNCSVVFANALTGEIIISAEKKAPNAENFNINLISGRANYEPGSALKIFTIGSAIENQLITSSSIFKVPDKIEIISNSCLEGYTGKDKGCFRDFLQHETYDLTVKEIIERSSNVGTILATESSDINDIELFLKRFGFSSKTGVQLTGETKGSFTEYNICKTCLSSLSIGYSVNVSQYQMVRAYSIIANGGRNVELTLTRGLNTNISNKKVISEELSQELKNLLINVVEGKNGTGKSLRMENYTIGGKTGTSRTHIEGVGYSNSRYNTSFTGFIETDEGPVVGSVLLWGASVSQSSEYVTGGSTAAPIFKTIVSYLVPGE